MGNDLLLTCNEHDIQTSNEEQNNNREQTDGGTIIHNQIDYMMIPQETLRRDKDILINSRAYNDMDFDSDLK